MNRLLTVVAVLVICGIGLGFYLGWFQLGSTSTQGGTEYKLTVDKEKFKADKNEAEKKVEDTVRGTK